MSLEFCHIAYSYGQYQALSDINLTASAGEITCLLGSSGCGKTTLLNLAAGLLPLQQGSIHINGELLCDMSRNPPPERRPVGLVFQDGALFPHLTIAENIVFGLGKGIDKRAIAAAWLDRIGLTGFGGRYPNSLSGGQQQRVALARAMAPKPAVLLMDEPFASVDIVLRRALRREVRHLLKERGATAILVTHDPEEAMDIGDRIAVMEAGSIIQADTPAALYDAPASVSVGTLFGEAQVITARRTGEGLATAFGIWPASCVANDLPENTELDLLVRADTLDMKDDPQGLHVRDVRRCGPGRRFVLVNADGAELTVTHLAPDDLALDARIAVLPRERSLFAFARDPESSLLRDK